jgi:hypothetical protein
MTYVIEDNVPVRGRVTTRESMGELSKTISLLEVGQSFVATDRGKNTVRRAVSLTQKRLERKYSTRTVETKEDGSEILRVWRVA